MLRNQLAPAAISSHQNRLSGRRRYTAAPAATKTAPATKSSTARSNGRPDTHRQYSANAPKASAAPPTSAGAT